MPERDNEEVFDGNEQQWDECKEVVLKNLKIIAEALEGLMRLHCEGKPFDPNFDAAAVLALDKDWRCPDFYHELILDEKP